MGIDISESTYSPEGNSGVTYEDAMKEMHVIDQQGNVLKQSDAIRHMYRVSHLGVLAWITELPVISTVCDELYVKFAKYRLNKALKGCDDKSCSVKLQHLRQKYKDSL